MFIGRGAWFISIVALGVLALCIPGVYSRFEMGLTWKISIDPKLEELDVVIPPFDELGLDACIDKVYLLNQSTHLYHWVFVPNCIQHDFIEANIVYREPSRHYVRPADIQISVEIASTSARIYNIPIDAHGKSVITLHIPQHIQHTIDMFEDIKTATNTRLIAKLSRASSGTGMYSHVGWRNGLQKRRTSSPLSSRMVCSSSGAGVSMWEVTNIDSGGGHTILTVDNEFHYLPASSIMNITVLTKPPYTIHTEIAQWIGHQRWSDGLETLQPAIYPSVSPGYHQACFCSLHMPCANGISRSLISTASMLVTKHDLLDQNRIASLRFQNVLTTMVLGGGEISILNSVLITLGVVIFVTTLLLVFRDAGGILPDTAESRRFQRSLDDTNTLPYDEAEIERQREINYAKGKRKREKASAERREKRKKKTNEALSESTTDDVVVVTKTVAYPTDMPSNARGNW